MKKLLLLLAFATGAGQLMAQDKTIVPNTKLPAPFLFKDSAFKAPILKDLGTLPQSNLKSVPKSLYDLKAMNNIKFNNAPLLAQNIDRMPVAVLQGQSKMPVVVLDGHSNMPVIGKPSKAQTVTLDKP